MLIYIFIILIILIIFLLYLLFKRQYRNIIITVLCSLLIVEIILSPRNCMNAAIGGAELFFYKVFPSVFPFVVISNLIMCFDGIHIYSKLFGNILCYPIRMPKQCTFPIIVSALCGYPLGAKYSCDLYEKRIIDFCTYERLINIASNAGPLFIIGSVGTAMLNNTYLGYLLLAANYLSCIIMGLILPNKILNDNNNNNMHLNKYSNGNANIGSAFKESVENSIKTSFSIAGFIIFFSVLYSIIISNPIFKMFISFISQMFHINKALIESVILGVIEMTNGCNFASMSNINIIYKIALIGFFLGFSGFSVISQVYSFTAKLGLSIKKYIIRKFFQGIVSSVISLLLYILYSFSNKSISTFNSNLNKITEPIFLIFLCIVLIIPFIYSEMRSLT